MKPPPEAGMAAHAPQGWRKGPLPPGTYYWGGVATRDTSDGFYFADFMGDHALVKPGTQSGERIEPADILWFNNDLDLPPPPA